MPGWLNTDQVWQMIGFGESGRTLQEALATRRFVMTQLAAIEAVVTYTLLVALMGAWDGLVRRHIRLSIDVIQMHIKLRGIPAMAVGVLSLLMIALLVRLVVPYVWSVATDCQGRVTCVAGRVLLPALTVWQSALVMLVGVFLFVYWASGAGDLNGPYRRHLLAPGVWDTDQEILALVASHLRATNLPPVDDDAVTQMASWVRERMKIFQDPGRESLAWEEQLVNAESLTHILLSTRGVRRFRLSEQALPVVLATIVSYYEDKYEQAAHVWPWRRTVLP